jgi:terminal uridylyltransferase
MFPTDTSNGDGRGIRRDGNLENHLRNLILTNAPTHPDIPVGAQFPPLSAAAPAPSRTHEFSQHDSFHKPHRQAQSSAAMSSQVPQEQFPRLPPTSPRAGRKRPNQAQRRQMSAQLSIPIDRRPNTLSESPRNHGPPVQGYHHNFHVADPAGSPLPSNPSSISGEVFAASSRIVPDPRQYHPLPPPGSSSVYGRPYNNQPPRLTRNSSTPLQSPRRTYQLRPEDIARESQFLEDICLKIIKGIEIEPQEIAEKEAFRVRIERICRSIIVQYETEHNGVRNFPPLSVELKCFGSLSSGFATKASDMDLGILSPLSQPQPDAPGSPIPRLLEKAFLNAGLGSRLLTKTRIPIIKMCEYPPQELMLDLLQEREKWENGTENQTNEAAEEGEPDEETIQEKESGEIVHGMSAGVDEESSNNAKPTVEQRLSSIRQRDKQSLPAYYSATKRTLKILGGRDITISNIREFTLENFSILNSVCHAFVRGLADQELRQRLESYRSISFDLTGNTPKAHTSLLAVYTQVEGEKIAMMWDQRSVKESTTELERQGELSLRVWINLQNKPPFENDPITFTKETQLTFEKLKKVPSIQLMLLEQGQHESSTSYCKRALQIQSTLVAPDHEPPESARRAFIDYFVVGIRNQEVRLAVKDYVLLGNYPSIVSVMRRQKSLQLAHEFERVLERGLYSRDMADDVAAYISILKGPLRQSNTGDLHHAWVIPKTNSSFQLIEKMRDLPDPRKMSPNQPRDQYRDRLEFPKAGVGVQCDINFSAHLALQNTLLLRCYSHTDPRVRPMVLFVKYWAKVRGINSGYRGTLSSYGYVLMVLHYLVNIAHPFVCPNLQHLTQPPSPNLSRHEIEQTVKCKGNNVQFWRNEDEIKKLAAENLLNQNKESVGSLLRGFFEYYSQKNIMSTVPHMGFEWGRDVLSLRTPGGLLTKQEKGWTEARTVLQYQPATLPSPGDSPSLPGEEQGQVTGAIPDNTQKANTGPKAGDFKEVRHRFLFAIEDPFELEHNVARTVAHSGIVLIRDEFRRAWRIIKSAGNGNPFMDLLQDVTSAKDSAVSRREFLELLDEIHGSELFG